MITHSYQTRAILMPTQTNKRRFNDDQVKSLETTFQAESKPELPLKKHLANELGLQPKQVAIWFQNKRARSKSKQIERDYVMLKSSYDNLASQLEALNKENQSLLTKVERLRSMAGKRDVEGNKYENLVTLETPRNPRFPVVVGQETDVLNMDHIVEGCSLVSPENGCSFESFSFLDKNTMGSSEQWWEF